MVNMTYNDNKNTASLQPIVMQQMLITLLLFAANTE